MPSKSSLSQGIFMLFFLLCTSILSASANVNLVRKAMNSLGMVTFVGIQRYNQPITRHLLINEAKAALNAIPVSNNKKPAIMSALYAGGNEVLFATSARGQGTVPGNSNDELQVAASVLEELKKCAADFGTHNYDGKCGEIMNLSEWFRLHPGKTLPKEKMIVAVNAKGVAPPCNANEEKGTYGCAQFLKSMGFDSTEIIDKEEPEAEACELTPSGSHKRSLGKRACKRPAQGLKKTNAPTPKSAKPVPSKGSAKPIGKRQLPQKIRPIGKRQIPPKHRPAGKRSVQPRQNGWMAY